MWRSIIDTVFAKGRSEQHHRCLSSLIGCLPTCPVAMARGMHPLRAVLPLLLLLLLATAAAAGPGHGVHGADSCVKAPRCCCSLVRSPARPARSPAVYTRLCGWTLDVWRNTRLLPPRMGSLGRVIRAGYEFPTWSVSQPAAQGQRCCCWHATPCGPFLVFTERERESKREGESRRHGGRGTEVKRKKRVEAPSSLPLHKNLEEGGAPAKA